MGILGYLTIACHVLSIIVIIATLWLNHKTAKILKERNDSRDSFYLEAEKLLGYSIDPRNKPALGNKARNTGKNGDKL